MTAINKHTIIHDGFQPTDIDLAAARGCTRCNGRGMVPETAYPEYGEYWTKCECQRPAPRRHLSERRRVELMLPGLIALRLAHVMIPVGADETAQVEAAKAAFDATAMEAVADLPPKDQEHIRVRATRLRAWLLDAYAGRAGLTVLQAFTLWLTDLHERGVLVIADGCDFLTHWDTVADGILRHPDNVEGLERCRRSAARMAAEWRRRLEQRGYYREA